MSSSHPMTTSLQTLPTDTSELLEELCLALRHVGVGDHDLPSGERVTAHILSVQRLSAVLLARGVDVRPRLERLSTETGWLMPELLADCLGVPAPQPYVRESDGIRRTLRCQRCHRAERPPDAWIFWFCDGCLHEVLTALRTRQPLSGVVLFRSYSSECWCRHADAETVLACDHYVDTLSGVCELCVGAELERRHAAPDT